MKTLHLVLKAKWYDMIASGEKIDPVKHGIGCTNQDETPNARNGKTRGRSNERVSFF